MENKNKEQMKIENITIKPNTTLVISIRKGGNLPLFKKYYPFDASSVKVGNISDPYKIQKKIDEKYEIYNTEAEVLAIADVITSNIINISVNEYNIENKETNTFHFTGGDEDEKAILNNFAKFISTNESTLTWKGWDKTSYDICFLCRRAILLDIESVSIYKKILRNIIKNTEVCEDISDYWFSRTTAKADALLTLSNELKLDVAKSKDSALLNSTPLDITKMSNDTYFIYICLYMKFLDEYLKMVSV